MSALDAKDEVTLLYGPADGMRIPDPVAKGVRVFLGLRVDFAIGVPDAKGHIGALRYWSQLKHSEVNGLTVNYLYNAANKRYEYSPQSGKGK